jgi:hypothetical protein
MVRDFVASMHAQRLCNLPPSSEDPHAHRGSLPTDGAHLVHYHDLVVAPSSSAEVAAWEEDV